MFSVLNLSIGGSSISNFFLMSPQKFPAFYTIPNACHTFCDIFSLSIINDCQLYSKICFILTKYFIPYIFTHFAILSVLIYFIVGNSISKYVQIFATSFYTRCTIFLLLYLKMMSWIPSPRPSYILEIDLRVSQLWICLKTVK